MEKLAKWEIEYLRKERIEGRFGSCINKGLTWIAEMRHENPDATQEQAAYLDKLASLLITLSCQKQVTIPFDENDCDDFLHVFCCMQRRLRKRNGKQYATYFWDNRYYLELWPEYAEEGEFC